MTLSFFCDAVPDDDVDENDYGATVVVAVGLKNKGCDT